MANDSVGMVAFIFAAVFAVIVAVMLTAADCPQGQVAVKSIWGWPVCVNGGP